MRVFGLFKYMVLAGCFVSLQACASKPQPAVQSPVSQPDPVVSQPVEPEVVQAPSEPAEQIAPQIQALRDAVEHGDAVSIETSAHEVIDAFPETPHAAEALRALAGLNMQRQQYDQALLYADAALSIDRTDAQSLLLNARILHALHRDDEAVKVLNEGIEKAPQNAALYRLKAAVLLEYLDVERALQAAQKAHELSPSDCAVQVVYADALFAAKRFEESASTYESARSQCKLSEKSLQNLAKLYEVHTQNPQKACELYKQLCDLDPGNAYYKASRDYQCSL